MADWKKRALEAEKRAGVLEQAFKDTYWMARRYADGRQTYVPKMYNDAVDAVLSLGITLQFDAVEGGNKLYASGRGEP